MTERIDIGRMSAHTRNVAIQNRRRVDNAMRQFWQHGYAALKNAVKGVSESYERYEEATKEQKEAFAKCKEIVEKSKDEKEAQNDKIENALSKF